MKIVDAHLMEARGFAFGTTRIAGIDFLFHFTASGENRKGWLVGIDDDGVRNAMRFERPPRDDGEILAILRAAATGPVTPLEESWPIVIGHLLREPHGVSPLSRLLGTDTFASPSGVSTAAREERERSWKRIEEISRVALDRLGADRISMAMRMAKEMANDARAGECPPGDPRTAPWPMRASREQFRAAMEFTARNPRMRHAVRWARPRDFDGPVEGTAERLLANLGVAPATARRYGPASPTLSPAILATLRAIPIDWVPGRDDVQGWRNLRLAVDGMDGQMTSGDRLSSLLLPCKGRWAEFVQRMIAAARLDDEGRAPTPMPTAISNALSDVMDMVRGFAEILPGADLEGRPSQEALVLAWDAVAGSKGLPALMETSWLWHRRFTPVEGSRPDLSWDAVLPAWTEPGSGIEVVPLKTAGELVQEGDRTDGGLAHCVGGGAYSLGSARGEIRILSVRREGKRLSTAEIELPTGRVIQHRGERNGPAPSDAEQALKAYLALPETAQALREGPGPLDLRIGFDEGLFPEVVETWRPYLAGRWRNASAQNFLDALAPPDIPMPP